MDCACSCSFRFFFFSSRRRHTRSLCDWSSDVCSSDLLRINEVAFGGSGVGKADGKVIFVPFSIDGELLQVRITQSHKRFSLASVQTILQTSPHREKPPCPYYQTCGGCDYQHT